MKWKTGCSNRKVYDEPINEYVKKDPGSLTTVVYTHDKMSRLIGFLLATYASR
jgi:hypothetical protein